jgi:hypothetical protein
MVGCGGKVVVDADGGLVDEDGGLTEMTSCEKACARVVAACNEQDEASCVATCEKNVEQSQTNGCEDINDALVSCIATASDAVVCGGGMGVPASCQSLYDQWDACF